MLRPWANGMDVTRRPSDTWIIDFGWKMTEAEAAFYFAPYAKGMESPYPYKDFPIVPNWLLLGIKLWDGRWGMGDGSHQSVAV